MYHFVVRCNRTLRYCTGCNFFSIVAVGRGAGNSAYAPLTTAMITSWYKKSSWGKALGFYNTAMVIGGALGFVLFAALAESIGWRQTFYVVGVSAWRCPC